MSETPENSLPGGDQISEAFQKILQNPDIISNVAAAICNAMLYQILR